MVGAGAGAWSALDVFADGWMTGFYGCMALSSESGAVGRRRWVGGVRCDVKGWSGRRERSCRGQCGRWVWGRGVCQSVYDCERALSAGWVGGREGVEKGDGDGSEGSREGGFWDEGVVNVGSLCSVGCEKVVGLGRVWAEALKRKMQTP